MTKEFSKDEVSFSFTEDTICVHYKVGADAVALMKCELALVQETAEEWFEVGPGQGAEYQVARRVARSEARFLELFLAYTHEWLDRADFGEDLHSDMHAYADEFASYTGLPESKELLMLFFAAFQERNATELASVSKQLAKMINQVIRRVGSPMTNSQEKALSELRRMIEDAERRTQDFQKNSPDASDILGVHIAALTMLMLYAGWRVAKTGATESLDEPKNPPERQPVARPRDGRSGLSGGLRRRSEGG